ncbi:hypothetical protein J6590_086359 [Homalodisca vitripennis]|nr:hypothetical protein J6590_086359 [Homalodisca vitripennis]
MASRPSIHSINVRVCRDDLESRQTTRHASASTANTTSSRRVEAQYTIKCRLCRYFVVNQETLLNVQQFLGWVIPAAIIAAVLYAHARAIVASPTSAKNLSSRISQQTAADATNVAPRWLCQCDLSYLTTWLAIILKIHPQMDGRYATAV